MERNPRRKRPGGDWRPVIRTVPAGHLPPEATDGQMWSECGVRITSKSAAIDHAAACCSVGVVREDD